MKDVIGAGTPQERQTTVGQGEVDWHGVENFEVRRLPALLSAPAG